ncbi:hypothetical protein BS50DRAFT_18058 [Corynespora cassiicola Philippines]|uniref:Uncharacterized protein n=1 Tax=Corynespora cassiicola Philippines TaxID=1448308 RepID=A0A2T2PA43_CORCC|nr:hypothetical protein BS50DRAFT_18058 [Corynespora cassiicola Philippines]
MKPTMDPLYQYGSHAFVPYLAELQPRTSATSRSEAAAQHAQDLPPISLLNTSTWTYCGPILSPTSSHLPPSFHTWSAATVSGPLLPRLLPFLSFLQDFLCKAGVQHYWLTIRATKATADYDTARWHTDDIFFDSDGEKDRVGLKPGKSKKKRGYWKLATTLLGPSTLFLHEGDRARKIQREAKRAECEKRGEHTCTSMRCLGCTDTVEAVRQTLARVLATEQVDRPEYGEAAFFRLGDVEGAVHSEPQCNTDRIFVNVVPGTEKELRSLMGRWGMTFPRAWCFGVPIPFDDMQGPSSAGSSIKSSAPTLEDTRGKAEEKVDSPMEDTARMRLSTSTKISSSMAGYEFTAQAHRERSCSTMSTNLANEYALWLEQKGFQFSQVFGR